MAYSKLGWVNGGAPALSATNLNHMDDGIDASDEKLDALGVQTTLDAEATPDDTDYVLVKDTEDAGKVKKTLLSEIWTWIKANLASDKAAVLTAINVEDGADVTDKTNVATAIEAGTATATPADTDIVPSISAAHAAQKSTWAQIKAAIVAGVKATAAQIVTGTSDLVLLTVKGLKDSLALDGSWLTKRTKMPDGATAVYSQDAWATTDEWTSDFSPSPSVSGGTISFKGDLYRITAGVYNKICNVRIKCTSGDSTIRVYAGISSEGVVGMPLKKNIYRILQVQLAQAANSYIVLSSFDTSATFEIDWIWIGDYSYLPGSLSEEAARIANLRGDVLASGQFASQTITASLTTLPTATKGDTVGGKKYTFVAALTASPGVEGEVLIDATGATDADKCKNTLENLNLALSETARTNNGTLYWAAAVHPLVSSARVNEVLTLTARTKNGPENAITVVCESGTQHTAGGATLLNGYTDSAAKTIAEAENNIAGGRTRPAAAKMEITNTALIGYEDELDKAVGATLAIPAGGVWIWFVHGYGANVGGQKKGSASGGATLTMAGANGSIWYRKYS